MNLPEIQKLITHLRGLPSIPPSYKFTKYLMLDFFWDSPCGTIGCIAGEYLIMSKVSFLTVDHHQLPHLAAQGLGLPNTQLFFIQQWPAHLRDKYYFLPEADVAAQREVMIEAIEAYVQNPDQFGGWTWQQQSNPFAGSLSHPAHVREEEFELVGV